MPRISRVGAVAALIGLMALPLTQAVAAQVLPQVSVTATDASASEPGTNTGAFTVSRTGDLTSGITVGYGVSGTATSGSDYTALSGSVALASGASSATVAVNPLDDLLDETSETVILTLAAGAGYTVGSPSSASVQIGDNDGVVEDDDDGHGHGKGHAKHAGGAKPGWGHGDKNHEHFGPAGHGCSADEPCSEDSVVTTLAKQTTQSTQTTAGVTSSGTASKAQSSDHGPKAKPADHPSQKKADNGKSGKGKK